MTADRDNSDNMAEAHSGSVHTKPKPGSNLAARITLLIILACLVAALIGVIWVFPRYVHKTPVPDLGVPTERTEPAPPTQTQTRLAREKREAERALGGFLQRQAALEGQEIATWGGKDYEEVLLTLAEADAAFTNGDFRLASTKYIAASAMLNDLESSKPERLNQALAVAAAALESYDAEMATRHYEIALALEPQNKQAMNGAKRAANVGQLAAWLAQARELEQAGDWAAARGMYAQATALDPQSNEARQGLVRVNAEIDTQRFQALMSDALVATKNEQFDLARAALSAAAKLKPESAEVRDAQERLRLAVQEQRIAAHRQLVKSLVQAERWEEAAQEYVAVLAIDPQAQFAVRGLKQSNRLAKLHDQLDHYIQHPGRLQSAEPRANARTLLASLRTMKDKGPRLTQKEQRLIRVLELAETPVKVRLQSDEMTDVRIDRVRDLGRFKESTVTLLPGNYIVRGSRVGYRDIRLNLKVVGGAAAPPVIVQCEEKI